MKEKLQDEIRLSCVKTDKPDVSYLKDAAEQKCEMNLVIVSSSLNVLRCVIDSCRAPNVPKSYLLSLRERHKLNLYSLKRAQ